MRNARHTRATSALPAAKSEARHSIVDSDAQQLVGYRRGNLCARVSKAVQAVGRLIEEATDLFARRIFPDPVEWLGRPVRNADDDYIQRIRWPLSGMVIPEGSGMFTDGGGYENHYPRLRVAGWAAVAADHNCEVIAAIGGVELMREPPE